MNDGDRSSPLSTAFYAPVDAMRKVVLLKGVPLFASLNAQHLVPVTEILNDVSFEEGDAIVEAGEDGHTLYIVVDGEVQRDEPGRPSRILGPASSFGEVSILDAGTHAATYRARTDVRLYAIARDDFQDLFDLYPSLARVVMRVLVQRLRAATAAHR